MIAPALLCFAFAGPPATPPDPVEVAPVEVTPASDPATTPAETPPAMRGSVVVSVIGTDVDALDTALAARLAPLGLHASVAVDDDFELAPERLREDRILEVWISARPGAGLRIVMTDPTHAHTDVRTIPADDPPSAVAIEETALIIEAMAARVASGEAWPAPAPTAQIAIAQPERTPEREPQPEPEPQPAPEPEPEAEPPSFAGLSSRIGTAYALAVDGDRTLHHGIAFTGRIGWTFARLQRHPGLRLSIGGGFDSFFRAVSARDELSQGSFVAQTRLGGVHRRLFGYGIAGLGIGRTRRRPSADDQPTSTTTGAIGQGGLGAAILFHQRRHRSMALSLEITGSVSPGPISVLMVTVGIETFWDLVARRQAQ